jgi:hypothetical protein
LVCLPGQILGATAEILKPSVLEPKNVNALWDKNLKTLDSTNITVKVQRLAKLPKSKTKVRNCAWKFSGTEQLGVLPQQRLLRSGVFNATFDEVRAMNCVRGESRMFVIPNQKIVLVICTKFYSAKSIHAAFRQNILSAAIRDCQTKPPVSQNNKEGQHYKPGT